MRILVIEDDETLRTAVHSTLRTAGFAVDSVGDLAPADEALFVNGYDCAVFDRLLPGGDALDYVERKRAEGWAVPVLFLTALGDPDQRVAGLRRGGDDYLEKPFVIAEMVARVRSLCRRGRIAPPPVLRAGDLELDTGRHEVRRGGVLLSLTRTEFAVVRCLLENAGRPVARKELMKAGWDINADPTSNVLDVLLTGLRRKLLTPPLITTVPKAGYRIG
ncbi:response regulator transcription factor [Amycolatopsis sp. QT-25]|uniref:response regulator transcription factor n=1 Tax=Amycolatopsis sp. QT-25 TaxID=3034022 RepID=UPI0023ED549F|nr:response regulator transcription factor [Amycolatopsis sp. QT-25]WET82410.1 response regulator transcription factor [Amycolatopsis sp. QT-25]